LKTTLFLKGKTSLLKKFDDHDVFQRAAKVFEDEQPQGKISHELADSKLLLRRLAY